MKDWFLVFYATYDMTNIFILKNILDVRQQVKVQYQYIIYYINRPANKS